VCEKQDLRTRLRADAAQPHPETGREEITDLDRSGKMSWLLAFFSSLTFREAFFAARKDFWR